MADQRKKRPMESGDDSDDATANDPLDEERAVKLRHKFKKSTSSVSGTDSNHPNFIWSKIAPSLLRIGTWQYMEKDLVAKFYYKSKKIIWEFSGKRIEILFDDIEAMKANYYPVDYPAPASLELTLTKNPSFVDDPSQATQPRVQTTDNSNDGYDHNKPNLSHYLECSNDSDELTQTIEKLKLADQRLKRLIEAPDVQNALDVIETEIDAEIDEHIPPTDEEALKKQEDNFKNLL